MTFADRVDAGRRLAARLGHLRGQDVVVLGLPRGGVPVAAEVATALGAPLDVILVRKIGVPWQPELAMGAIGEDGVRVVDSATVRALGITAAMFDEVEIRERAELGRRAVLLRRTPMVTVAGRTALIVDDGIATGSTARAACRVARAHGAERVVLAVPVAPRSTLERLRIDADEIVAVETPVDLRAVGEWYRDFSPVEDAEVVATLRGLDGDAAQDVDIPVGRHHRVHGDLTVPAAPRGLVVFAHGSGSTRRSPRNRAVARVLQDAGLATLLFDLLTPLEASDRRAVFDIPLLGSRLAAAARWTSTRPALRGLPTGFFGASTGAAAAIWAATEPDVRAAAIVCRGGRPDLAGDRLARVRAPTLLLVGSDDTTVLELNEDAAARLRCETRIDVIPGATHLFVEPGTLDEVARLARDWFVDHLTSAGVARSA
jgi:putative phosphoribosyl transferase